MNKLTYTDDFWARAIELAVTNPKWCSECGKPNGHRDIGLDGNPKPRTKPLLVRVALRHGKGITPDNLGLFCTRCRHGRATEVRIRQEDLDRLVLPLFTRDGEPVK